MTGKGRDTAEFLRIMNERNAAIAAREAEKGRPEEPSEDPIRLQREKERREKYGELRAREHSGKRGRQVRTLWGYQDLT